MNPGRAAFGFMVFEVNSKFGIRIACATTGLWSYEIASAPPSSRALNWGRRTYDRGSLPIKEDREKAEHECDRDGCDGGRHDRGTENDYQQCKPAHSEHRDRKSTRLNSSH